MSACVVIDSSQLEVCTKTSTLVPIHNYELSCAFMCEMQTAHCTTLEDLLALFDKSQDLVYSACGMETPLDKIKMSMIVSGKQSHDVLQVHARVCVKGRGLRRK